MNILHELYQELISFSGFGPLMEMYHTGNYSPLHTAHGVFSALSPVIPLLLFFIMIVDGMWGAFIHVGENILRDGRMGFLNRVILTPSHHRVHHAKNPLYMDTNFCNLLNIWDRVFRTYQPEEKDTRIEYGITRPLNPRNFMDVYFGEFYYLWKDIRKAPGLKNKVLYLFMPPGWSHTGDHKTAVV